MLTQMYLIVNWLTLWESISSCMHNRVLFNCLPSYIKAAWTVLQIFKMIKYFLDRLYRLILSNQFPQIYYLSHKILLVIFDNILGMSNVILYLVQNKDKLVQKIQCVIVSTRVLFLMWYTKMYANNIVTFFLLNILCT